MANTISATTPIQLILVSGTRTTQPLPHLITVHGGEKLDFPELPDGKLAVSVLSISLNVQVQRGRFLALHRDFRQRQVQLLVLLWLRHWLQVFCNTMVKNMSCCT
ncbi:hypothetical protein C1H46_011752 [Malus baccata]|uniref:Uncharacterized protein n=1 Tax=Malus baccata TaxID=106549 RepID=A0A540MUW6_MALBA|nr:hypothetical protein C1H46_011752 [Malus baccata]